MRKESADVMRAFLSGEQCRRARTATDGQTVWLHGNRIAWRLPDGSICMTLCGWNTVTTRDRLNTLCRLLNRPDAKGFHQHKHEPYFNDRPIESDFVVCLRPQVTLLAA